MDPAPDRSWRIGIRQCGGTLERSKQGCVVLVDIEKNEVSSGFHQSEPTMGKGRGICVEFAAAVLLPRVLNC